MPSLLAGQNWCYGALSQLNLSWLAVSKLCCPSVFANQRTISCSGNSRPHVQIYRTNWPIQSYSHVFLPNPLKEKGRGSASRWMSKSSRGSTRESDEEIESQSLGLSLAVDSHPKLTDKNSPYIFDSLLGPTILSLSPST